MENRSHRSFIKEMFCPNFFYTGTHTHTTVPSVSHAQAYNWYYLINDKKRKQHRLFLLILRQTITLLNVRFKKKKLITSKEEFIQTRWSKRCTVCYIIIFRLLRKRKQAFDQVYSRTLGKISLPREVSSDESINYRSFHRFRIGQRGSGILTTFNKASSRRVHS